MDKVQARGALVGAWRLVSWENRVADGQVTYPMGTDALGALLYTADGRFSVTISQQGRLALSASPLLLAGKQQVPRLVWERVEPWPGAG